MRHVVIQNKKGETVAAVNAPAVVELDRGYKYFWPARYTATVEAPGYRSEQFEIKSKLNPWTYGNIVLGGPIGLVVDDATGAMWKPAQESYVQNLKPMEAVAASPAIPAWNPGSQYPGVPPASYPAGQLAANPASSPPSYPATNTPVYPVGQATSVSAIPGAAPASMIR